MNPEPVNAYNTINVLIIRPGALGDTLMLLPALVDLLGKSLITYVGRQPGLGVIKDYVSSATDLEDHGWHRLFLETPHSQGLPTPKTDLAIVFFGDRDGTIRRNLEAHLPDTPIHIFSSFPKKGQDIHVAQYLANCLKAAGLPVDPDRSIKTILSTGLPKQQVVLEKKDNIVFHPGSGDPGKNHSPDFWLSLIAAFKKKTETRRLNPVLLLGPAETGLYPFFRESLEPINVEIRVSPEKTRLKTILGEAVLYVGHDSGITHLAAMLGTPTVALFKETRVVQWRPLGPSVMVIRQKKAAPNLINKTVKTALSLQCQLTMDK
jgi:heptosyltransferase-3